jgi:hypothetical protein
MSIQEKKSAKGNSYAIVKFSDNKSELTMTIHEVFDDEHILGLLHKYLGDEYSLSILLEHKFPQIISPFKSTPYNFQISYFIIIVKRVLRRQ